MKRQALPLLVLTLLFLGFLCTHANTLDMPGGKKSEGKKSQSLFKRAGKAIVKGFKRLLPTVVRAAVAFDFDQTLSIKDHRKSERDSLGDEHEPWDDLGGPERTQMLATHFEQLRQAGVAMYVVSRSSKDTSQELHKFDNFLNHLGQFIPRNHIIVVPTNMDNKNEELEGIRQKHHLTADHVVLVDDSGEDSMLDMISPAGHAGFSTVHVRNFDSRGKYRAQPGVNEGDFQLLFAKLAELGVQISEPHLDLDAQSVPKLMSASASLTDSGSASASLTHSSSNSNLAYSG